MSIENPSSGFHNLNYNVVLEETSPSQNEDDCSNRSYTQCCQHIGMDNNEKPKNNGERKHMYEYINYNRTLLNLNQ